MAASADVIDFPKARSNCSHCLARFACPFANPDEESPPRSAARSVRRDEHLFRVGDPANGLYVVRSGAIKTYVMTPNGEEQVLGLHGPGELLSVDALGEATQVSNAVALDISTVCPVSTERVTEGCARSPDFCRSLLAALSDRVRHDEGQFVVLGHKNADQRVASFLVEQIDALARRQQPTDELLLPMPRADIASYLAMAVETVSRVLTRLQEAGIVRVNRNLIGIADEAALRRTAGISESRYQANRRHTSAS